MLSGCNPWEKATTEDPCFADFIKDEQHFQYMVPLSRAAGALLHRIFSLNPLSRPSISAIRKAVLEMDSFFMSEEENARAEASLSKKQARVLVTLDVPAPLAGAANSVLQDNVYHEEHIEDVDEFCEDIDSLFSDEEIDLGTLDLDDDSDWGFACTSALTSATTSGCDSEGPATPGVYACETELAIPELAEGEILGEAIISLPGPAQLEGKNTKEHPSPALSLLERLEMIVLA